MLAIVMTIFSSIQTVHYPLELDKSPERMEQFGGGSLEEQCGSITFEDMFIYDNAIFEVRVAEDWKSAEVDARAWINWTLADDIRTDLDAYLEDFIPSGGDGWLSTDEINAVIIIAADCLEYSITRIGIRDGSPHRGGIGVDWKNTSWESDGMVVGHYNGVPPRHSQSRDCDEFSQEGCIEIPVKPSTERDCDTDINGSALQDECRIELWLNATMSIEGVSDPNNFTLAFNTSNMSNGRIEFTFPSIPDLRLDMWEECEGRFVGPDEENPGTDYAPIRGSCIGDGSAEYELRTNDDGSLTYSLESNFSREVWPLGEDIFADFTTSPIPIDMPPEWTDSAPINGTWIPVQKEGNVKLGTWNEISTWFEDESGVSNLELHCSTDSSDEKITQSIDGSLWANVQGVVQFSCEATDPSGQSSGERTWSIGVPLKITDCNCLLQNPQPISVNLSPGWPDINLRIGLSQGGEPGNIVDLELGERTTLQLSSNGMVPGQVDVWVEAFHDPDFKMVTLIDIGLEKESVPPQVVFSSYYLDGSDLKISGQYSDPDGEDVGFTVEFYDGADASELSEVLTSGNSWEFVWYEPDLTSFSGLIDVVVTGCDQSGKCTSEEFSIDPSEIRTSAEGGPYEESGSESDSLPAPGLLYVSFSIICAILIGRSRRY